MDLAFRKHLIAKPLINQLVLAVATLIMLGAASGGLAAWKLWSDARDGAQAQAHNYGVLLAEQTVRSLQATGLALEQIQTDLIKDDVDTPAAFRGLAGSRAFFDKMTERLKALPQSAVLLMFEADGTVLNTTRQWPAPVLNVFDRDYMQYCREPHSADQYLSANVVSRATSAPTFFLVRCIVSSSGQLLGVTGSAIDIKYYMDFYASIGLPPGASMAIRRKGGDALVRYPSTGPDAPPRTAPASDAGRFVSVLPISFYPLTMEVGLSRGVALAQWRGQVQWIVTCAASATLGILLLLRRLLGMVRGFQRVQAALMDRNSALSAAKQHLKGQTETLLRQAEALRQSEGRLAKQTSLLETTLEHIDQGLIMVDANREVAVCNRRAAEMMDLPLQLMLSRPNFSDVLAYQVQHQEFVCTPPDIQEFVRSGGILDQPHTYERQRPNGNFVEIRSVPLAGGGVVRTYTDITGRKASEQRLTYLAYHDELTGLANRLLLHETLRSSIATAAQSGSGLAVLYLDLDRFKLINDTRGHEVGNRLLVQVANRIRTCVPETATIARNGGDEFAVILPGHLSSETALPLAERLRQRLSEPYALEDDLCRVGVSIGVAMFPSDGATVDGLLRSSDSALYRAKATGRNAVCCHEVAAEQDAHGRLILEQDLRLAIDGEQFELAYQPIVDTISGQPRSFEALIRWRHPSRGLVPPDQFIPVAEETGLIKEIGRWVLQTACKEAATWAAPVRLAVNLSSVQFAQPDLEAQVMAALNASGLPSDRLDLEVTETVLISESDQVRQTMLALRRRGIRLVMDDFGTGHSSLKALQGFPFQQFKIDRSFVAAIDDEAGAGAIVRAMLLMASSMKLDVVAEGVETQAQLDSLRGLGCRFVQGFLLGRPSTPQSTRDYLWRSMVRAEDRVMAL